MNRWLILGLIGIIIILGYLKLSRPPMSSSTTPSPTPLTTPTPKLIPRTKTYISPPSLTIDKTASYSALLTTNKGTIKINLFAQDTPITVNNFVFLANEGFYNLTPFHRVVKNFMIQGGDPTGTGTGGPGYQFADEPITRNYTRGILAMANSGPNTNGSQFFIIHQNYDLPKNYVIFGLIDPRDSQSLATLDALANTPTTDNGQGEPSKPLEPLTLESVTIQKL